MFWYLKTCLFCVGLSEQFANFCEDYSKNARLPSNSPRPAVIIATPTNGIDKIRQGSQMILTEL